MFCGFLHKNTPEKSKNRMPYLRGLWDGLQKNARWNARWKLNTLYKKIRGTGLTRYPSKKEDKNRIKDVVVMKFEEILRNSRKLWEIQIMYVPLLFLMQTHPDGIIIQLPDTALQVIRVPFLRIAQPSASKKPFFLPSSVSASNFSFVPSGLSLT